MRSLRILLALVAILLVAAPASAQDTDELTIEQLDVADHPEVTMVVSVPAGVGTGELDSTAFSIDEDGEARAVEATALPSDDLEVVLLLDTSQSMAGEPLDAARSAASSFVAAMPEGVRISVVSFASDAVVLSSFSTDRDETSAAIVGLEPGGETALYDGLGAATGEFGAADARRVVVLLSDGGDTISESTVDDAEEALLGADATFYAVELQSPENDNVALRELTTAADGALVPASDPDALTGIFDEVAAQIINRYELSYTSESYDSTVVTLTVNGSDAVASSTRTVTMPAAPPPPPAPVTTTVAPVEQPLHPEVSQATTSQVDLSLLQSRTGLLVGLGAAFLAIAGLFLFTGAGERRNGGTRLAGMTGVFTRKDTNSITSLSEQATEFAEKTLERSGRTTAFNTLLEQAGLWLRPGEFIVITAGFTLGAMALGLVLFGAWAAITFAVVALLLARLRLSMKANKRRNRFAEQLPDCIQLMSGGLRAGFGMMQTVENIATEVPAPAGEEFQRVKIESHLGRDTNDALRAMARRVGSEDFEWVVEAIEIHREVGGDLGDILDAVGDTIRDRNRIRRRIKALSAEGRVSAVVLGVLPFAILGLVLAINPTYLAELVNSLAGQVLSIGGILGLVIGVFWMAQITKPKF